MWIKQGTDIVTQDGDRVGQVDRVVMDPRNQEITHVVVRKGFLFPEDRVVGLDLLEPKEENQMILQADVDDLSAFPEFEETEYVLVDDRELLGQDDYEIEGYAPPLFWYPSTALSVGSPIYRPNYWNAYPGGDQFDNAYRKEVDKNIPPGTIALKEGAKVISSDGKHVGNLEQILLRQGEDRASHFVISSGLLISEEKLLPSEWIIDATDEEVHVGVRASFIESLPPFEG